MANTPAPFKQVDVTRALKGAEAADMEVGGFRIEPDGSILVFAKGEAHLTAKNSIDKMLGL